MKIRIVNDTGIGRRTKIMNVDTGEKISGICDAIIHCPVEGTVTAKLIVNIPEIDILAVAKLSEKSKQDLKHLREVLEGIEGIEKVQMAKEQQKPPPPPPPKRLIREGVEIVKHQRGKS